MRAVVSIRRRAKTATREATHLDTEGMPVGSARVPGIVGKVDHLRSLTDILRERRNVSRHSVGFFRTIASNRRSRISVRYCMSKQSLIKRIRPDGSNLACYVKVFTSSSRERR